MRLVVVPISRTIRGCGARWYRRIGRVIRPKGCKYIPRSGRAAAIIDGTVDRIERLVELRRIIVPINSLVNIAETFLDRPA